MNEFFVSDESPDLSIEECENNIDILVTYKGKSFSGNKISIESSEDNEDVDVNQIKKFVSKLSELMEFKHPYLIEICFIIYSGSQEQEGIVPIMFLCSLESKSFKSMNETAHLLDQFKLAKTISELSSLINSLHSRFFYHNNLNSDNIYFNSSTKNYHLHPIHIIESMVVSIFGTNKTTESKDFKEKNDLFQFANTFRKMFLDYPNISSMLSCSITFILDDCLLTDFNNRPSSKRVSDALEGIMLGFQSMQNEIDRLRKCLTDAEKQNSQINFDTIKNNASPKARVLPSNSSSTTTKKITGSISVQAVQEKRSSSGSFDRSIQLFKFKLKEGIPVTVWETESKIEAMEVTLSIEEDTRLVFIPPVTYRLFSFVSGKQTVANVSFSHIIECWAGAPPDVLDDNMNNDLNFLTLALEDEYDSRRITMMFQSMEERDEIIMGIRNLVAVSSMMVQDDTNNNDNFSSHSSYVNADLNEGTLGSIYPESSVSSENDFGFSSNNVSGESSDQIISMTNPMGVGINNRPGSDRRLSTDMSFSNPMMNGKVTRY